VSREEELALFLNATFNPKTNKNRDLFIDAFGHERGFRVPDFGRLFEVMSNNEEIKLRYQVIQPDGNVATGWGTRAEIDRLKRNFQVRVEGEDHDFKEGSNNAHRLVEKAAKLLDSEQIKGLIGQFAAPSKPKAKKKAVREGRKLNEDSLEDDDYEEEFEEGNPFSPDAVSASVKNALTVVASGSKDVLISTAKNTWEALIHAGAAVAGMVVIAVSGLVVKKTVQMLPGAAANVGKIMNNLLESTSNQVKLLTAHAIEAAKEAAEEAAEEAAGSAKEARGSAKDAKGFAEHAESSAKRVESEMIDGVAAWVDAD
jgi:hypothetical protein